MDNWAQSLVILSDQAKEIRESPFNKFMAIDRKLKFQLIFLEVQSKSNEQKNYLRI